VQSQHEDAGRGNSGRFYRHSARPAVSDVESADNALRVLRTRGLSTAAMQHVFRSTVVARLMYAASSWRGLTKASDIASASTWSSIAPVVMATARRSCRPSTTSATLLTMNSSLRYPTVKPRLACTTTTTINRITTL